MTGFTLNMAQQRCSAALSSLLYQSCHFPCLQEWVIKKRNFDSCLIGVKIKINGLAEIWVISNQVSCRFSTMKQFAKKKKGKIKIKRKKN